VSNPLLATKLSLPPSRLNLVSRTRLTEQLDKGLEGNLTLLSAPAGFGKTTLVTEWLRCVKRAVTCLSLDEADNDPARFLAYLLEALRQVDQRIGEATYKVLQAPQPPPADLLMTTLLNEIAAIPDQFIFAIDDYHVIQTPAIHQQLSFIVDHQPSQMHLVVLTREDPPLPLARLRARRQVNEIRQNGLRFTSQEAAEFLGKVMGLQISPQDVAALEHRTEGWITGLQLAALSMQRQDDMAGFVREFTGSNRYVLDYLIEEVFQQQTTDVRDFLLATSILESLSGSLCDAVAGRTGSQDVLEALEKVNLFLVPLDQSRNFYRYHRLFAELLRHRLRLLSDPSEESLHQRACEWYRQEGFILEAIPHALSANDWALASELIQQASGELLMRGEVFTLLGWFSRVPEDVLLADPKLCHEYGWPLILAGQFEAAAFYLNHAEQQIGDDEA